jgi:alkanesulfonate monooxygenase SsuD/methylene tetrahydromethanopterin reductase-like flavin-dependent oxidoreductase (luciferase family)
MRFNVVALGTTSGMEWRERVLRYEAAGFDSLYVPDHVGLFDPFATAAAAASVTERLRLGTLVLTSASGTRCF